MTSVVITRNRYNLARRANVFEESLRDVWEARRHFIAFAPYNMEVIILIASTESYTHDV